MFAVNYSNFSIRMKVLLSALKDGHERWDDKGYMYTEVSMHHAIT